MPITVPTLATESVRPDPIRAPLQRGEGVDLSGLTQGLSEAAVAIESSNQQLSQIRVSAAETEILNRWNARLNEDDDAYYKKGGQGAVESLDPSMQELDDIAGEVMGQLKDGTERRILTDALSLRRMNHRTKMSLHSFDSRQQWDRNTALANRQAQLEAAITDPSPENLRLARERIIDETNAISKIDHMPKEAAEANARIAVSGMYRMTIENLIAQKKPFEAQALFDRYGPDGTDEIHGEDQTALIDALSAATIASESSILALEAQNTSDNPSEQIEHARSKYGKNPSPKQLEIINAATRKIAEQRNQAETADSIVRSDNYEFLGKIVIDEMRDKGGRRGLELIEGLQAEYPERFSQGALTTPNRVQLMALATEAAPTVSTREGKQQLSNILLLAAVEPSRLGQTKTDSEGRTTFVWDPMDYADIMSPGDLQKAGDAIRKAQGSGITTNTGSMSAFESKLLNRTASEHGIDLTVSLDDMTPTGRLILREALERRDEWISLQDREPTDSEWQDIVDNMFVEVFLPGNEPPPELELFISGTLIPSPRALPSFIHRQFSGDPEGIRAFRLTAGDLAPYEQKVRAHFNLTFPNRGRIGLNELETHFVQLLASENGRKYLEGELEASVVEVEGGAGGQ